MNNTKVIQMNDSIPQSIFSHLHLIKYKLYPTPGKLHHFCDF